MSDVKVEIYQGNAEDYAVRIDGHLFGHMPSGSSLHSTPGASIPYHPRILGFQRLARAGKRPRVELIKCNHCPRVGVAIDDYRITSHKCAGQWTVIWKTNQSLPASLLNPWRKASEAQNRRWAQEKKVRDLACAKARRAFLRAVTGYSGDEVLDAFRRITPRGRERWHMDHFVDNYPEMRTKRALADHWGRQGYYTCADFVRDVSLEALTKALADVTATPEIRYHYRGPVERAGWCDGYSQGEGTRVLYPWMTRKECQADAKAQGGRAAFIQNGKRAGPYPE